MEIISYLPVIGLPPLPVGFHDTVSEFPDDEDKNKMGGGGGRSTTTSNTISSFPKTFSASHV